MKYSYLQKNSVLITLILALNVITSSVVAYAQAVDIQTASLNIGPGDNIDIVAVPDSFNFPTTFIPSDSSIVKIYKTLTPLTTNQNLIVGDSDVNSGFRITISSSDFTDGPNTISSEKLSIVTLSESLTDPVDFNERTTGIVNVLVPLDCNWDPNNILTTLMQSACDSQLEVNHFQTGIEKEIISNTNIGDIGVYSLGFGLRLDIDNTVIPGNYSGVITFTKIVI